MSEPSKKPVVLAGICGGVAAYKAVDAVSRLNKAGFDVHVAMTEAAQQFVGPVTFSAVSGNRVLTEMFPDPTTHARDELFPHLYPSTQADLFVLMPATADIIAKVVHGLGSDVVSTAALSLRPSCVRVFCPSMNVEMWNQPVVQANVAALEKAGWHRIGPNAGTLACGMEGKGRMVEPADIADEIVRLLHPAEGALNGRNVLIISGPTREHLDPVRFIGNPSTGKMGRALAEEAAAMGAAVQFVTGPVDPSNEPARPDIEIHRVVSADDMLKASQSFYGTADVIVYAAAVADYKPVNVHGEKLPKTPGRLQVELEATPDVSATLNAAKRPGQVAIGFALQTHDGVKHASAKLAKKHLDGIVLNSLDAIGGDRGTYTFLHAANGHAARVEEWGNLDKRACARRILTEAAALLSAPRS